MSAKRTINILSDYRFIPGAAAGSTPPLPTVSLAPTSSRWPTPSKTILVATASNWRRRLRTAFASYRRNDKTVMIMHTEVPRALEGRGVGSQLVAGTLDLIRDEGRKVVPMCSFVRYFINTHPDCADLLR